MVPPEVMLPEGRLEVLVGQALNSQLASCPFHNAQPAAISLLHDFQCGQEQIPTCTTQVRFSPPASAIPPRGGGQGLLGILRCAAKHLEASWNIDQREPQIVGMQMLSNA